MNERIRQLKQQAKDFYLLQEDLDCSTKQLHELVESKFAELIVKECLMIVYERQVRAPTDDDGYFKVALDIVSKDIEQHFGVEL